MTAPDRWYGKHRGTVVDADDPEGGGRVSVEVPSVGASGWALPCFSVPGLFAVPPVGSTVWVEFEQGDPAYPVWTGCLSAADAPAEVRLTTGDGAQVVLGGAEVELTNGAGASLRLRGSDVELDGVPLTRP